VSIVSEAPAPEMYFRQKKNNFVSIEMVNFIYLILQLNIQMYMYREENTSDKKQKTA
jgi:hypothetical protein